MNPKLKTFLQVSICFFLAAMPFHAFLVTWAKHAGATAFLAVWKEDLIAILLVLPAGWLLLRERALRRAVLWDRLNQMVLFYLFLHTLFLTFTPQPLNATTAAFKANLIFLAFFGLARIAFFQAPKEHLARLHWLIMIPALLVSVLGVAQATVLPQDFLTRFGYSESTIHPAIYINQSDIVRAFSTTSGPNQLGTYLLLPLAIGLYRLKNRFDTKSMLLLAPIGLALLLSYSRSAWIAAAVMVAVIFRDKLQKIYRQKAALAVAGSGVLLLAALIYIAPFVPIVNNVILHGDEDITHERLLEGSTAGHIRFFANGAEVFAEEPLGSGLASAGPASLLTPRPLIPESYYLQLAIELGFLGLITFLYIIWLTGRKLYSLSRRNSLGAALLSSLIGISVVNLVLHGWTDVTTSVVWWGACGIFIAIEKGRARA